MNLHEERLQSEWAELAGRQWVFGAGINRLETAFHEVIQQIPLHDRVTLLRRISGVVRDDLAGDALGRVDSGDKPFIRIDEARLPSDDLLKALLAHEAAHVACGHHLLSPPGGKMTVDRAQSIYRSRESEVAERLASWEMSHYAEVLAKWQAARTLAEAMKSL